MAEAALDYSLADSWEIRIDGTNVTRLVTAGDFEWSILSLNPPAPIVQIGTLQLAANQLSGVSFSLNAIAPNSLVQFYWKGSLVVAARVADVEVTQWDRFGVTPEAVLLNLTDKLRQSLEAPTIGRPIVIQSAVSQAVAPRLSWVDYVQRLLTRPQNASGVPFFQPSDVLVAGLPTTLPGRDFRGNQRIDGFSTSQGGEDQPVQLAAAIAAVRGYALYCNAQEQIEFRPLTGGSPSRRYAIEQVRSVTPDNALTAPASAVTVSGSVENVKRLNNEPETIIEQQRGIPPTVVESSGQRSAIVIVQNTQILGAYDRNRRRQQDTYRVRTRIFALPNGGTNFSFNVTEEGSTTTQFNRRGLLESIIKTRRVNQRTIDASLGENLISIPPDQELWEYDRNGVPTSHTVERSGIIESNDEIVGYIAQRTIETWAESRGQYRFQRRIFRPQDEAAGELNLVLVDVQSQDVTADQIPSPTTAPVLTELETTSFSVSAKLQGTGQEVQVQLLGATPESAQRFCNLFATIEAKRQTPRRCVRRLANNESAAPFTIEDVGRLRLRRDGIAININGDAVSLSYSGIVEGVLSAPVPFPKRTVPTGELYQLPASGVVPPPLALRIIGLEPFTTVQDTPIAPISLAAVGGTPPYTFAATGLPAGLSIVGNTILGTPTAPFSGNVTIAVQDAAMDNDDTLWALTVLAVAPVAVPPPESILVIEANSIGNAAGLGAAFVPGVEANSIAIAFGTAKAKDIFDANSLTLALSQGQALSLVNGIGLTIATSNAESTIELWSPSLIIIDLWLDGADENVLEFSGSPVAENDPASTWLDKSGNDRAMESFFIPGMPLRSQNGLLFDGINDRYQMRSGGDRLALTSNASALTTFHVVDLFSGSNQRNIIRTGASTILHAPGANNLAYRRVSADPLTAPSYGVSTAIDAGITLTSHCIDFENGEALVARNGADYDVYHTFTNTGLTESGFPSTWMGASPLNATTANIDGRIHEVIMIRGVISDPLRQVIEGYLAHKYGIASKLPASHPYKNNPPSSNDP